MRPFIRGVFSIVLLISTSCTTACLAGDYWTNQFTFPETAESEPENATPPRFRSEGPHLLSVFQIMTDLGRQQMLHLDRVAGNKGTVVGSYSIDQVAKQWPREYVQDFLRDEKISLPLFSLSEAGLRGFFGGYNSGRMRAFPHTLICDASGGIHRIFRGVQSQEVLETALEAAKNPWTGIPTDMQNDSENNQLTNGGFESLGADGFPQGWSVYRSGKGSALGSPGTGWKESSSLEIRSTPEMEYQIVFQIVPHQTLLGKKVRLEGLARSNSLGKPRIALAIPHPQIEAGYDFLPRAPIQTRSGKGIPLRILGGLTYETDHSQWQSLSTEIEIPTDARALVLALYLDNPTAPGGAARFDSTRLISLD